MRRILNLLLTLVISLLFVVTYNVTASNLEPDTFGNWYFNYESEFDFDTYYANANTTDSDSLRNTLHQIISANTSKCSYQQAYDYLKIIDEYPGDPKSIYCIITGNPIIKENTGSGGTDFWNREHIWAKSYGFGTTEHEKSAPWNDLNHLHAAEAYGNSTYHNNRVYDNVSNPTNNPDTCYGNLYNDYYYEPRDAVKGDIARMIFYMDIRYEGNPEDEGYQLSIIESKPSVTSDKTGYMGILSTLIEWMAEDPVDDYERSRNDKVYAIQGNRNPFIDHPEYANIIYGANYPTDKHQVHYFPGNGKFDVIDSKFYKANEALNVPNSEPIPNEVGYKFAGWYLDSEFKKKANLEEILFTDSDINLYAKYEFKGYTEEEAFGLTKTEYSMTFNYKMVAGSSEMIVENSKVSVSSGSGKYGNAKSNTEFISEIAPYLEYDTSLFTCSFLTNSKAYMYVSSGTIRLSCSSDGKGNAFKIKVNDGRDVKITDVKIVASLSSTAVVNKLEDGYSLTINEEGSEAIIQNIIPINTTNRIDITEIEIFYTSKDQSATDYSYKITGDVTMWYQINISEDLLSYITKNTADVEYGFLVDGVKIAKVLTNGRITHSINVKSNEYGNNHTVFGYIKIDNNFYYSDAYNDNPKVFSVKSLAKYYTTYYFDDPVIKEHLAILRVLAN